MSYIPPLFDIVVNQNATYDLEVTILDASDTPIDITSWTFRGSVKKKYADTVIVADFIFAIVDGPTGKLKISLPPNRTALLVKPHYYYDVLVVMPITGEVVRIMEGNVIARPAVTS